MRSPWMFRFLKDLVRCVAAARDALSVLRLGQARACSGTRLGQLCAPTKHNDVAGTQEQAALQCVFLVTTLCIT